MARKSEAKPGSMWWLSTIMGALLLGPGSVLIYQYIDEKEREGGTIRMHWLAVLFYDMLGKVGLTVLMAVVGVAVLITAAFEFRKSRRTT